MDTLSIPGFVPLPRLPPAWEGKVPELEIVVKDLGDMLLVASFSKDGDFLAPLDTDVPCAINDEITTVLQDLRVQFPRKESKKDDEEKKDALGVSADYTSRSYEALGASMHIAKVITGASHNLLLVSPSSDQLAVEDISLWLHNPSTTRRFDWEAETVVWTWQNAA